MRLVTILTLSLASIPGARADEVATSLPVGVRAVRALSKAYRETTSTRERICINGLWRWQPAQAQSTQPPSQAWGYFKVPGCWPGITDYLQKDSQTVYPHPAWLSTRLAGVTSAWYEREVTVPAEWTGRRIGIEVEYLNSYAAVFVDGKRLGEIRFPGGTLELNDACRPGETHRLTLLVVALPLKDLMLSYNDTASARQVRGSVPRRGLCGDVYMSSTPTGPRLDQMKVDTSMRRGEITFNTAIQGLADGARYRLKVRIAQDGREVIELTSKPFQQTDLVHNRFTFREKWQPDRLWDIHTPSNMYSLSLSLIDSNGKVVDTLWDQRFGFREFWIEGRDFFLNGTRIYLSAVPLDNAQVSAALATYEGARKSLLRLKSFGINFVYTHNYGCEPGSHLSFAEVLRAADDVGMLVAFSQPHFSHYDWKAAAADRDNGYRAHAEFYVRMAQHHPSVVLYSMSHNATGYAEDMNPDLIDGVHDPRDTWASNNVKLALRAEGIVKDLDPSRIVYHHSSGNLGSMHTANFYPNFAPIQELSDWFEHWATEGVKPMFTCEYGAPFTWDWAMYRGWYKGERTFGSARVPWEFCMAEWNAQFLGDRAYRITEMEKANLRWEAKQFRAGNLWHRWDYPYELGSRLFDDRHEVIGRYLSDNFRAFRTWGVSAISPWEYGHFWRLRDGVTKRRKDLPVDWDELQRPGFSPDFVDTVYERFDLAYERTDWLPTADGAALIRNNRPLLAYIAGSPAHFTSKDHNFGPGETVEKQLIVINNSRQTVTGDCKWSLNLPEPITGRMRVTVATGQQERIPLTLELPASLQPGRYELTAECSFSSGETQRDSFSMDALAAPVPPLTAAGRIALFDPKGETAALLKKLGTSFETVNAHEDLSQYEVLVIGKAALSVDGPGPRIERVRDGLKVVVFEQTSEVLEKRLGFRVEEYGLRQVFPRLPNHPLLSGISTEHLRDWRGESTTLPPRLAYEMRPRYGPTVRWCDIPVTRIWRCGNRGNVASVLIEKPARGDFLPLIDGGFSLQYSPLLEYREGQGTVLFSQLDVNGRTESDPVATSLARNILGYACGWKPSLTRRALYAGDPAGLRHLESAGIAVGRYDGGKLSPTDVLVVGPGGGQALEGNARAIGEWLKAGGHVLAIGLDAREANAFLPLKLDTKTAEHIATTFEPFATQSPLAGIAPADVHNRDPRDLPLVTSGATIFGDGILAQSEAANVVFCQLVPWRFDPGGSPNLKRTFRRASFLVSRILANMGVASRTPILSRFSVPPGQDDRRWKEGLYLDQPEEWDDPYRFFRW
jgi:hypothetical protein